MMCADCPRQPQTGPLKVRCRSICCMNDGRLKVGAPGKLIPAQITGADYRRIEKARKARRAVAHRPVGR